MVNMRTIFLSMLCCFALANDDLIRAVLTGWGGDGKTHFCNKYENDQCGLECSSVKSCTTDAYMGNHFIDTPGFGENRLDYGSVNNPLKGSLHSIEVSLTATNATYIRAIVWMVACLDHRAKPESLLMTKIMVRMIGKPVPLVVIFNTATSKTDKCEMNPQEFIDVAKEYGVDIREVILFTEFDLDAFENKYHQKYQVIIPENLHEILARDDPTAELERLRNLQCLSLPDQIEKLHQHQTQLINNIKKDFECPTRQCSIPSIPQENCLHEHCAEYRWIDVGITKIRNGCSRTEMISDQACVVRVSANAAARNRNLEACIQAANNDVNQCLESLKRQHDYNDGIRTQLATLSKQEEFIVAKQRTCEQHTVPL